MLYEVIPQTPLQRPPSLTESLLRRRAYMRALLIKRFRFKKRDKLVQFNATVWFDIFHG
jgi:hypothetical protein